MLRVGTSNLHCEVQLALQDVKGAVILALLKGPLA
jgi:hypothetical protein